MKTSESISDIAAALVEFQAVCGNVKKDKKADVRSKKGEGASYSYDFASIDDVCLHIRGPMHDHGLSQHQGGNAEGVVTTLLHKSGQWIEHLMPWPMNVPGGPQVNGGNLTVARRYALLAALGIAATGDDDDAELAQRVHAYASAISSDDCRELLEQRGANAKEAKAMLDEFVKSCDGKPTPEQRFAFYQQCRKWEPVGDELEGAE